MNAKIIFTRLLLLTLFSSLIGCTADLEVIKKDPINSEQLITVHKNFEFVKLNKTISKIILNSEKAKSSTISSKIVQTKDFKIFTNTVTYTTRSDKSRESYSFYIERNNSLELDYIENLIFTKNDNDESYRTFIVTYSFPDEINSYHKNFQIISFKEINSETLSVKNLFAKTACQDSYTYNIIETGHDCYSGEHNGAGQAGSCNGGAKPYSTFSIEVLIATCGGTSGGGTTTPDPTPEGGTTGSTNPNTGNTLPVDTGITFPSPCQTDDCSEMLIVNEINDLLDNSLDYFQLEWLAMNNDAANEIKGFLLQNSTASNKEFVNEMINYCIVNPDVTWEKIENWFMGASEGEDGDYDSTIWDDPNLTFPQQNLPSFNDFKNACPSKYTTPDNLCNTIIGGDISTMYNSVIAQNKKLNTCAIRISRALNYSNIVIPSLPDNPNGTKNTVKGADGLNYIINAKTLNAWMKKTFGTNPTNYSHYSSSQGGVKGENFPGLLVGKKGIYSMVSLPTIQNSWGTGHADLYENGECLLNCHFYDINNNFVPVDFIDFWILN